MDDDKDINSDSYKNKSCCQSERGQTNVKGNGYMEKCSKCNSTLELYDMFCSTCSKAIPKHFKDVFIFQVILFLGLGIALGMYPLPSLIMLFIGQFFFFFCLWFSKKQKEFIYMFMVFIGFMFLFVLDWQTNFVFSLVLTSYFIYRFGELAKEKSNNDTLLKVYFIWTLVILSYGCFLLISYILPPFAVIPNRASHFLESFKNVVWLAVGGYIVTFIAASALKMDIGVISLKTDWINPINIKSGPQLDSVGKPMILIPVIVIKETLQKIGFSILNLTVNIPVAILNACMGSIYYLSKFIIVFISSVTKEFSRTLLPSLSFLGKCIRSKVIPSIAVLISAIFAVTLSEVITEYVHDSHWLHVPSILFYLFSAFFFWFIFSVNIVEYDIRKASQCFLKNIVVLLAYIVMIFPFLSLALWIIAKVFERIMGEQVLPYKIGMFSLSTFLIMLAFFIGILYWRFKGRLEEVQKGKSQ